MSDLYLGVLLVIAAMTLIFFGPELGKTMSRKILRSRRRIRRSRIALRKGQRVRSRKVTWWGILPTTDRLRTDPVLVVSALVLHGGRILIGQKIAGPHPAGLGGKWVLPGGRVEEGEPLVDALQREVLEETGLRVDTGEALGEHTDLRANGSTRILYSVCHPRSLDLRAGDDLQAVAWVERSRVLACLDPLALALLSPEARVWLEG